MPVKNSFLAVCSVIHQRNFPRKHRFKYGLLMFLLDLDEVAALSAAHLGFVTGPVSWFKKWGVQFNEADHGDPEDLRPLKTRVQQYVACHITPEPVQTVLLLTQCRFLGYLFNPVSFYFCLNAHDQFIAGIAEVGNTFYEQKWYALPVTQTHKVDTMVAKNYYVSPFLSVKDWFRFRLSWPLTQPVLVDTYPEGEDKPRLTSVMSISPQPFTPMNLVKLLFSFPLASMVVMFRIHWQAFQLWLKRIPYCEKHLSPERQQDVFRAFTP
jgi:uncharacterized protein